MPPTDRKSVVIVIVVLQTVALRNHLQLAGDITATYVGELRQGRKDVTVKASCYFVKQEHLLHLHSSSSSLTMTPNLVLNSPAKDLTRSTSSQRAALKSISKGLKPLLATRFTGVRKGKRQKVLISQRRHSAHVAHRTITGTFTGAVGPVCRVRRLPHAVKRTEVAVHGILSEAVAVVAVKGAVDAVLLLGADKFPVHWHVRLFAGRPCGPPWLVRTTKFL